MSRESSGTGSVERGKDSKEVAVRGRRRKDVARRRDRFMIIIFSSIGHKLFYEDFIKCLPLCICSISPVI
tara:strand:- start:57 stop:266 length:210 start_codon:yes stop_codon:yes gene_type:complete